MIEISEKSKKNEIFDAYNSLLKKIQNTKEESHQEVKVKHQNEEVVVRAAKFDTEQIVTTLGQAKVMITQNLGLLEKKLTEEYDRLNELQQAIKVESKHLEELHQIKKNADSLAALLLAQKERKASFDVEMEELRKTLEHEIELKRTEWRLEKERYDQLKVEYEVANKKERVRDEDEYRYKIAVERKKDQDVYENKKALLERDLAEKKELFEKNCGTRQAVLEMAEDELKSQRNRVAGFPKELENAVSLTEKSVTESLEREYRYSMNLKSAEIEGEKRLQQQTIVSLQAKIKEQDILIRELSARAETASQQVQSIALKALEGATGIVKNDREENKLAPRS